MTATRSSKANKHYKHHQAHIEPPSKICVFCALKPGDKQVLRQTKHFKIVQNIFPYTLWDSQTVDDHLTISPIKHTDTLSDLSEKAAKEFVDLIGEYESNGYSVYARAPGNVTKSITHQHTHLIKLSGHKVRFLMYLKRPYKRFVVR